MAGYIGKISAVVTANTSDLQRKMAGAADATTKFADTLNRSLNKSSQDAKASIEKIFTPLQQLERKLQAALQANIRFAGSKGVTAAQADAIRALAQTVEQLNKPLQSAAEQFNRLGLDVQASFAPALQRVQSYVVAVNQGVEQTGRISERSFGIARAGIQSATEAIQRLTQAQQLVSQSFTGTELQFTSPEFFRTLNANAATGRAAASLPTEALEDGSIGRQLQQLRQYQEVAASAQAKVESLRLDPKVDPAVLEQAEKRFRDATKTAQLFGQQLDETISAAAIANANKYLTIVGQEEAKLDRVNKILSDIAQKRQSTADALRAASTPQGIASTLDTQALGVAEAKIGILTRELNGLASGEAPEAEEAIRKLGNALADAFDNGTIRAKATTEQIEQLTNEAVNKTASATGGSADKLGERLKRVGDVARGSFGNASLAIQQAAFAVDDFFSVSGGLDQRIRAAGNNLSQLGFIIGGTTGLIVGIATSIGAQLVAALLKWAGAVEDTQSKTDALNSLLQEQKTITDSLAQSYRALGDSIRNAGLNEAGRTRQDRERQRRGIVQGEEDRRRALLASVDPEVQRLTEQRSSLRRRLEESPGAGERASLDAQLAELEPQIAAARARAAGRVGVGARAALEAQARLRSAAEARSQGRRGATVVLPNAGAQESERILSEDLRSVEAQRSALRRTIQELQSRIESVSGFFGDPELRKELDTQLQTLVAELALVEDQGLKEGFLAAVDNVFKLADGLDRVRQNLEGTGLENGEISQQVERINELQNSLLDRLQQAREAGNLELIEGLELSISGLDEWKDELLSASASTRLFASALDKVAGELTRTVAGEFASFADQTRREANAARANPLADRGGFFEDEIKAATARERLVREEAALAAGEARRIEASRLEAVQEFERNASGLDGLAGALVRERDALAEEASGAGVSVARRQAIEARQAQIAAELSDLFENTEQGRDLRRQADEFDEQATRRRSVFESAVRGEQLLRTPAEQAAIDLSQSLFDIQKAAQVRQAAGIPLDPAVLAEAEQRARDEAFRAAAPAVFALRDASENAVLSGPSRARLNASDITTQAGTDELNRLLRGDDSAREQNLVELRKQTSKLEDIDEKLAAIGVA